MKHLVVLLLSLLITLPVFAQTEKTAKISDHNMDNQAEENATIIRTRLDALEAVLKSVQWEPHKSPGLDAPEQEKKADHEWQKWFFSVRSDLQAYARTCKAFLKLNGEDMMSKMASMNMQFLALQDATLNESRKFQTLSNASKARHDIAMNAIRNMK